MSNILVTGGNGQLGSELKDFELSYPQYKFYFTDAVDLDITDHALVKEFIIKSSIKIIVNCAAHTAVDRAETEFELSNAINHLAVRNFAEIAKEHSIKLIQISTDYVFDG
jgi:dTDP-4-dehydrorhamnose reductase